MLRPVRHLHDFEDSDSARRLADALFAEKVPATVRETREGKHALWVDNDGDVGTARAALDLFLSDPDDPRFRSLQKAAEEKRKAIAVAEKKSRHKVMRAKEAFDKPRIGWLTGLFIGASVIVTLASQFGDNRQFTSLLYFATPLQTASGIALPTESLYQTYVVEYQWWRLFSPMLLHLSFFHLIFNMWWLKDLGTLVEHHESPGKLLALVVVSNLLASVAQYFVYPWFGGFSGVVYALFGYLWMRGRFDPTYPVSLGRSTVVWMMVWFVLCFSGIIPVANTAHAVGLAVGALWGYLGSGHLRRVVLRRG